MFESKAILKELDDTRNELVVLCDKLKNTEVELVVVDSSLFEIIAHKVNFVEDLMQDLGSKELDIIRIFLPEWKLDFLRAPKYDVDDIYALDVCPLAMGLGISHPFLQFLLDFDTQ